ncbi:MAG: acyl-CoA carboxylase subunit beta [Rhodocyclaceae bacterium]|nr:acyl-CoA carboxylase subunit beta [Rhodocyclaceae bacterium]MCA3143511.1 acyl-CoA carboxylase subunit beta [Rhodocyclaceae bacterium]
MESLLAQLRAAEARTREASAAVAPRFAKLGKRLPRERVALLLDPGMPVLELSTLAGWCQDHDDGKPRTPETTVPGGGAIAAIGYVSGVRCMVVADDAGIDAGALQPMGIEKFQRAQDIALANRLPFVHLIESAGANLLEYRVEHFVLGGRGFHNLARLSAAGIPVIGVVHGSSTAGGAYMTGLSDVVVMVRDRARAFLAGPPLLKAATGEIATDEELGGALMHATVSGTAEYLAEDDADAIRIAREVIAALPWRGHNLPLPEGTPPLHPADDLLGLMPADGRKPVDMREVIARLVDGSEFLEFKAGYGPQTVCGHARLCGMAVGLITNNGPLDPAGAGKATHFIQHCCQAGIALLYLQNTTGFLVGTEPERAGMIKIGSKMIQAVSNATVPQITVMCGASYGAGNYGMCGRAFGPRFVFSWPNARTAVMGAEQAATTMAIVMEEGARRRGTTVPPEAAAPLRARIVSRFESQQSAFHTSGLLLDDGVIDPRDTRAVVALALSVCLEAERRPVRPVSFGVGRM